MERIYYFLSLVISININLGESKTLLTILLRRENISADKDEKVKYMKALKWQVPSPKGYVDSTCFVRVFSEACCLRLS